MTARRAEEERRRRPPQRRPGIPRPAAIGIGAVVVVVLLVLLLRGCGDDSLSPEQLRSQAGEICARANAITDRVAVPNAPAGGVRFLEEGLAELRPASVRLAALKAPEELRDRYDRALSLMRDEIALIDRTVTSIRGGEETIDAFAVLQRDLAPVLTTENDVWRSLDVPACIRR